MNESVQKWLDELTAAPSTAIHKLVLGYAGVSAWSRSSLRKAFVEVFQTHADALDAAVAGWLQERLMKLPPEKTPTLVWGSHLQDLFSALAGLPLPLVARLLRDRLRDFRSWLRPLRSDESLDPEAAYLAALAWADTNQHLEGLWQGLALRRDHEPAYYIDIGLLGLRKTRNERGQLPSKAPFLLLATLIDLADTGISQKDWLLTTRSLLGGYHYSLDTWVREFEPVLESREDAERGPEWLKKVLPQLRAKQQGQPKQQAASSFNRSPTTFTRDDCDWMVNEVRQVGPAVLGDRVEHFLELHRTFANQSRNPHFLVRTFNRLAEAARTHDPDWAIVRAEEALEWDRNHEYCWTELARCLWARGLRAQAEGDVATAEHDCREAMDTLWTARHRFWWNAYVRTELGRLHRDAGEFETAEAIYREAVAEFPQNAACLCGLADVLARSGRVSEAENLYRQIGPRFLDNPYWRTGLAEILFRRSAVNRDEAERDESRTLLEEAADLRNHYARGRLNGFDQRWQRLANQLQARVAEEQETDESISLPPPTPGQMRPAQRLGRALLLQWQARRSESAGERERLFSEAAALLDLPDELTGECHTAFVEARGFLLLSRDQATDARAYFDQQLAAVAPRRPLGLRLGLAEARARLGDTLSDTEEAELASFGPAGSILPLVLRVVRLLESNASDDDLRDLLLQLYPRVRELAGMSASELGEEEDPVEATARSHQPETPDTMVAHLLLANIFRPAAVNTPNDLAAADAIRRIRASLKSHRDDILSVAEKLALAA
ncbi:MAG: tetratricopeptide repeat protein [Planctomycetota bacterium]|nr:tetratricopeptide repeat protein [Planctomycetota bacterium]